MNGHPASHSFGFGPLTDGRWLVDRIADTEGSLRWVPSCRVDLVVYPGEACSSNGPLSFSVFPDGLASYHRVVDRNRIHAEDVRIRFGGGAIRSYDFTAERHDDGGFRIVRMDARLVEHEAQPESQPPG